MMLSRSVEFWVIIQIAIDLCLIILFVIFLRQVKATTRPESSDVQRITSTLEPLLQDAHEVGRQFEAQLKEKQHIVRRLNQHLDSHIISLNSLLNRAETCLVSGENTFEGKKTLDKDVYDLQQEIITLSEKGLRAEKIANRLGIAKGEVTLVLDLRKKFREMEQV